MSLEDTGCGDPATAGPHAAMGGGEGSRQGSLESPLSLTQKHSDHQGHLGGGDAAGPSRLWG